MGCGTRRVAGIFGGPTTPDARAPRRSACGGWGKPRRLGTLPARTRAASRSQTGGAGSGMRAAGPHRWAGSAKATLPGVGRPRARLAYRSRWAPPRGGPRTRRQKRGPASRACPPWLVAARHIAEAVPRWWRCRATRSWQRPLGSKRARGRGRCMWWMGVWTWTYQGGLGPGCTCRLNGHGAASSRRHVQDPHCFLPTHLLAPAGGTPAAATAPPVRPRRPRAGRTEETPRRSDRRIRV